MLMKFTAKIVVRYTGKTYLGSWISRLSQPVHQELPRIRVVHFHQLPVEAEAQFAGRGVLQWYTGFHTLFQQLPSSELQAISPAVSEAAPDGSQGSDRRKM